MRKVPAAVGEAPVKCLIFVGVFGIIYAVKAQAGAGNVMIAAASWGRRLVLRRKKKGEQS
jgi:hypothetical protein